MLREINIDGVISGNITEQVFQDKFIEFIESLGLSFGGGINDITEED